MKRLFIVVAAMAMSVGAQAVTEQAQALIKVEAPLTITWSKDLDFGTVLQGDLAATVAPGDAEAAAFDIAGSPNTAYTITLPGNGDVVMITGGGGANETIAVDDFTSLPAATGLLDGAGTQTLTVGATHAAIGAAQVAGDYAADFTVEVVY